VELALILFFDLVERFATLYERGAGGRQCEQPYAHVEQQALNPQLGEVRFDQLISQPCYFDLGLLSLGAGELCSFLFEIQNVSAGALWAQVLEHRRVLQDAPEPPLGALPIPTNFVDDIGRKISEQARERAAIAIESVGELR
jgi:hypothetical protein